VLRDELALTGAKKGCNTGTCGRCNVLVDDVMIRSCLCLAVSVAECTVTTVEGLARNGMPSVVQQAFLDAGAIQCGFCMTGMIVSATRAARTEFGTGRATKSGSPSREIFALLWLCQGGRRHRTGGKPVPAGECSRSCGNGNPHMNLDNVNKVDGAVGLTMSRLEAWKKANGAAIFTEDMVLAGMLHGALALSKVAHARILGYEISAALALPGVKAVLTAMTSNRVIWGSWSRTRPCSPRAKSAISGAGGGGRGGRCRDARAAAAS